MINEILYFKKEYKGVSCGNINYIDIKEKIENKSSEATKNNL